MDSFGTEAAFNDLHYARNKDLLRQDYGGLSLKLKQFNTMYREFFVTLISPVAVNSSSAWLQEFKDTLVVLMVVTFMPVLSSF